MKYCVLLLLVLSLLLFLIYVGYLVGNKIACWFNTWQNRAKTNLKPCPFCGSPNVVNEIGVCNVHYVKCLACSCIGPIHNNSRQSVKAWNKREQINNTLYKFFKHYLEGKVHE